MSKLAVFCMGFSFLGVALIVLFNGGFSYGVYEYSALQSDHITAEVDAMTSGRSSRILKENTHDSNFGEEKKVNHNGDVILEDYRPFDPSPSSKASVRPGPIQHGTPLIPYIPSPKPSPPRPSDDDQTP